MKGRGDGVVKAQFNTRDSVPTSHARSKVKY